MTQAPSPHDRLKVFSPDSAAQLLEMMAEEWLLEGRRPEAAVVAAVLVAGKASGLRDS